MVLVQRRRGHHFVLALLFAAACGGDGPEIVVTVSVPEGGSALSGVTQFDFSVTHGSRRVAFISEPYESGDELSFDKVPHESDLVIGLVGRDVNGDALVYGSTTTGALSDSGTCCVTLCLCTDARQKAGGCTCGSNGCGDCGGN